MLHTYKHVGYDGLKGTCLIFLSPRIKWHWLIRSIRRQKKRNKREIEWNLCSLIYSLIQVILRGSPKDNSVSVCSKAAGHAVRGCLDSRVMCDWPQLRKLSLSEAPISSLSSFNSCSTHWRMEEKGASIYPKHDHGSTTTTGHSHLLEVCCGLGTELSVVSVNTSFNACTATQWGTVPIPALHKGQMVL